MAPNNAPAQRPDPRAANMMARNLIVGNAVKRTQQIYSAVHDPASEPVVNISPRNVGLILGFIVQIETNFAVADSTGTALTLTPFGPANLLSRVQFADLNNNTRINTTGWHLHSVNSARAGSPYLAARTNSTYPIAYGNYYTGLVKAAATIAQDANSDASMTYYVPLAYSEQDLRGSIYAGVVNATMQLQLTLNASAVAARTVAAGSDAVYVTASSATPPADVTTSPFTVRVYQVYYDQLPAGQNGTVLPLMDLSTVYELKSTTLTGLVANQDFPIPYSNFRDFLSTFALYRNREAVASGGFSLESDIASWALETANYVNLFKVNPDIAGSWGRQTIGDDFTLGMYYVNTRSKPIATQQYGNMNLVCNPADVQTGAAMLVGYEAFALQNMIAQAQGLAAS
jgi:hypothetical protein